MLNIYNSLSDEAKKEFEAAYSASYYPYCMSAMKMFLVASSWLCTAFMKRAGYQLFLWVTLIRHGCGRLGSKSDRSGQLVTWVYCIHSLQESVALMMAQIEVLRKKGHSYSEIIN